MQMKIAIVGPAASGKTALTTRIVDIFRGKSSIIDFDNYTSTIGIDFSRLVINKYKPFIYDVAGHEKYERVWQSHVCNSDIAIICIDKSPELARTLIDKYKSMFNNTTKYIIAVTKCDKDSLTQDNKKSFETIASQIDAPIFFTSAKDNIGIKEITTFVSSSVSSININALSTIDKISEAILTHDNWHFDGCWSRSSHQDDNKKPIPAGVRLILDVIKNSQLEPEAKLQQIQSIAAKRTGNYPGFFGFFGIVKRSRDTKEFYESIKTMK